MLFNSYEFLFLFLPITLVVYFILSKLRFTLGAKFWLVAASLFFYSWWNPIYLPLILLSIIFNYVFGMAIGRAARHPSASKDFAKILLGLAIGGNLVLLGYFKYMDFFIANINYLKGNHFNMLNLALPLGISFFTITQIAYQVDIYKQIANDYNLLNYSLFVTFFPHLICGPIIHHKEMMPQFDSLKSKLFNHKNFAQGLFLLSLGLFKKVIIADTFSVWAAQGFASQYALTTIEAWATSLSFTLQIYFDFSGYTDMALGLALMFNIKLPLNFNSPYKALNIQDFWRRWHMTLTRFLGEYLYIPLGGSRRGNYRTYVNLMATFVIAGIWHGAGWTYLVWGGLQGSALAVHRAWRQFNFNMPKFVAWFLTFNFFNATLVIFHAKNWNEAIKVYKGMFFLNGTILPSTLENKFKWLSSYGFKFGNYLEHIHGNDNTILMIIIALFICLYCKNSNELVRDFKPKWHLALFTTVMAFIAIMNIDKTTIFLYYNF
jgi:D-alanyl-lipoteichoic acid acyltransferase DltB (MBOAT superfamily)